jgi:hypothetical protein
VPLLLLLVLLLLLLQWRLFFCYSLQLPRVLPLLLLLLLLLLWHSLPAGHHVTSLTLLLLPQLLFHVLWRPILLQVQRTVVMLCCMQRCYCCPFGIYAVHVFQDVLRTRCCYCMCCSCVARYSLLAPLPLWRLRLLLLLRQLLARASNDACRHVHMLLHRCPHLPAPLLSCYCCCVLLPVARYLAAAAASCV